MSWHWRKLLLVLVKYKTFFCSKKLSQFCTSGLWCWLTNMSKLQNCAGEMWAFPGHPSCPWLRCCFPLRCLALLQQWLNCLWHWTAQITAWPTEETWNWHWLYINMLQLGSYFVRSWVMPAGGSEKSGNWESGMLQLTLLLSPARALCHFSTWAARESLPHPARDRNLGNVKELNFPSICCLQWSLSCDLCWIMPAKPHEGTF